MPANEKEVHGRSLDWPPTDFAFAQFVGGSVEMNWWSLARIVGRDNPWDLIIYNFQTEDPREVNFYMRTLLGCNKLYENNFVFFEADPGIIYVPPKSWVPPSRFKKGSSRRKYSRYISHLIAPIMRRAATVCPTVTGFGFSVSAADLRTAASHVEAGDIKCQIAPEIKFQNALGKYFTDDNKFLVAREPRSTHQDVTTIAHEGIHAGMDARKVKKILVSGGEMLAFTADCVIGARLFPNEVERILKAGRRARVDYDIVLAGWALAQDKTTRHNVNLDTLSTIRGSTVDDPFNKTKINIYSLLYDYIRLHYRPVWSDPIENDGIL